MLRVEKLHENRHTLFIIILFLLLSLSFSIHLIQFQSVKRLERQYLALEAIVAVQLDQETVKVVREETISPEDAKIRVARVRRRFKAM